jgi:predicted glycosyltransferase involved in capsule biosynthesis
MEESTRALILKMKSLASVPMKTEQETRRVEIIMLKFKEPPEVIDRAVSKIIHNTSWPFKLVIYDNRPNTANTSRIWNKLVRESTCDYVMLIDSDAFVPKLEPCWLTRMMESIDETGLVIPVSNAPGGQNQQQDPKPYPSKELNRGIWSGYCFLFKKSFYEKVGPFDEHFYIYGQDSEWAHRAGGAVMRTDTQVEHIGGASFSSDPVREEDKIYARTLFKVKTGR